MTRWARLATLAIGLGLRPHAASAQQAWFTPATIAASAAAAADWTSTYHALKNYRVREVNPLLHPFDTAPGSMVSLGAVVDSGAMTASNVWLARDHQRVAVAGLWSFA